MKSHLKLLILLILILSIGVYWLYPYKRSELMDSKAEFVIHISNGAALLKAIKDSPGGRLWNSPEMKPFLNNQSLEDALIKSIFLRQVPSSAIEEAALLNRKILSLLKGEVIVGFEFTKTDNEIEFFALAEMNKSDYKKILELFKLESKLTGEKTIFRLHTFQDVELVQDITTDDEGEISDWMGFYENTFIGSRSRQWVEQCIVRLKKELPVNPSGVPSFQLLLSDGFINHIIKGKNETEVILKALGFEGLGKVSLEWIINPTGSEVNLNIENNGWNRGLWTFISKDPLPDSHFLGYVPENVLSYHVMSVNLQAFWNEIPSMLEVFGPKASAQFQMGLSMISQTLQVDISRDIVADLDTVLTSYSRLKGTRDENLYAWQLRNSKTMEKALKKLFTEGSWLRISLKENFEMLDLKGYKVYCFKVHQYRMPIDEKENTSGNLPQATQISYGITVVDGDLVFGSLELIRPFIHGSHDNTMRRKFYKSPKFTNMIRRVPENAIAYGFFDITQWIKPAMNYFKNLSQVTDPQVPPEEKIDEKSDTNPIFDPFNDFLKNLKFELMPSPEFLSPFFGLCVNYYQFNGDELILKWEFHNPYPE